MYGQPWCPGGEVSGRTGTRPMRRNFPSGLEAKNADRYVTSHFLGVALKTELRPGKALGTQYRMPAALRLWAADRYRQVLPRFCRAAEQVSTCAVKSKPCQKKPAAWRQVFCVVSTIDGFVRLQH